MEKEYNLLKIIKDSSRLIRSKDMKNFRLVEEGVFDHQGNIRYNADLDQLSFYGFDGVNLERLENRRIYLDYDDIPENAKKVCILLEDERFYHHIGVDLRGLVRAVKSIVTGGGKQGASTITMQLVKILFLNYYPRTVKYKLVQMYLALLMERYYTKNQILELYINTIFCGNNSFGMPSASKLYFRKPLKDLSLSECMYLLIIAQRPGRYNPYASDDNIALLERLRIKFTEVCYTRKTLDYEEYSNSLKDVPKIIPMKETGNKKFDEIYTLRFCENKSEFAPEIEYVYDRLSAAGLSDSAIAGVMGNIHVESGFNPECKNFIARGLCQWNGERVEGLMATFPDTYMQIESQVDFMLSEFDAKSPNADSGSVEFYRLVQEKPERTASYYSDLFQALVERNLHQDHYDDVIVVSNPAGEFPVRNRLSRRPNEYDGLYYLDATRRRNYAEIYLDCIKHKTQQ